MSLPEFKLIVAGGRDYNNYDEVAAQICLLANNELKGYAVSIVSGMARGADALAAGFASNNNIKLYMFPANWDKYGKAAGFRRNEDMAKFADGLLAFWDGQSRGTKHMIETMKRLDGPVRIIHY